jgi:hypothetical protein
MQLSWQSSKIEVAVDARTNPHKLWWGRKPERNKPELNKPGLKETDDAKANHYRRGGSGNSGFEFDRLLGQCRNGFG